ncbi:hypothetical protein B0A53_05133 [Rhodotorula sp. CCFEE 5036]|nr:hypothetical protein B0A53_05133 [Rhodotorula sp. CCFEE 5036]
MAGDEDPPTFTSDEAAIAHYRSRCSALQAQLAAAEQDILEFTESSKELQAELEGELERMDKAEKGMRRELDDARNEKEEWKGKYTTALKDHTTTITHMQRELETLRATEKELRTRVRDMELDNDDLEKSEREKDSSLQSLETRYNKALERIALLEEELVAKAQLEEEVQRLKDEVRDVNEELLVTRSQAEAAEKAATAAAAAAATAPTLATRTTSPLPAKAPPLPPPIESADANSTLQRRTPSPESSPPSPSSSSQQPLIDPTPLPARIRRTSLIPSPPTSISPSKVSRPVTMRAEPFPSPPPPTGQTPFRAPLGRSTRTAHLQTYGLGRSPSSPALMASPSNRPHRGGGTRGGGDLPRTDTATMIRDMQQMTSRVRMLTQRLDQRRSSVMRGSAIPSSNGDFCFFVETVESIVDCILNGDDFFAPDDDQTAHAVEHWRTEIGDADEWVLPSGYYEPGWVHCPSASTETELESRSGRATPHQDESAAHDEDDRRHQLRSTMRRTSMGGTGGGANRRASGIGLGLASSGNSSSAPLSKSLGGGGGGRRASLAASYGANGGREGLHGGDHQHHHHRRTATTRDEVPPVPPLPTTSR